MENPDDQSGPGPGKCKLRVLFSEFTLKCGDDTHTMEGGELNLTVDTSTFTWGMLRDELEVHGEQEIEVKMDMDVKRRNDLVFPVDFKEQNIVLQVDVVDKMSKIGMKRKRDKTEMSMVKTSTTKKSCKDKRRYAGDARLSKPCGLLNDTTICYANSVFQCLSFTDPLISYLFSDDFGEECGVSSKCFLCDLHRLIANSRTHKVIDPEYLSRHIKECGDVFKSGGHQDPHELLLGATTLMARSAMKHGSKAIVDDIYTFNLSYEDECMECGKKWPSEPAFEECQFLALPIRVRGQGKLCASLEDCLKLIIGKEDVPRLKCAKCGKVGEVTRNTSVYSAPKILTVVLNRSDVIEGKGVKISGSVKLPTKLNLSPFMTNQEDISYDLYGVIVHEGNSIQRGHYKAYVKTHNDTWYCCNDIQVELNHDRISDLEGFVTFYIRNDEGAPPQLTKQHVESSVARPTSQGSQEEHEVEHSQEHEVESSEEECEEHEVKHDAGMLRTTRTLSLEHIKDRMHERYIIAEDRCRSTVIKRIKEAMRFCDRKEQKYMFEVPGTSKVIYDPRMGHFCLPRRHGAFKKRSTEDPKTGKKAKGIFFILNKVLHNLKKGGPPLGQKEIQYKNPGLFKRDTKVEDSKKDYEKVFVSLVEEICILLETTRDSLNIVVVPRGHITGEVQQIINGGGSSYSGEHGHGSSSYSCENGRVIPEEVLHLIRIETKGEIRFILMVEKYQMYSKLMKLRFHKKHKCVIITPQGQPTVATRFLLRQLSLGLNVPVYGLVDLNASGVLILSTFMIGSTARAFDNLNLTIPTIEWIGVHPTDVAILTNIPTTPMSKRDTEVLKTLTELPHPANKKFGPHPQAGLFEDMLKIKYNVNIDAIIEHYGGIEQYLLSRIPEMVVKKKKSKKSKEKKKSS